MNQTVGAKGSTSQVAGGYLEISWSYLADHPI